MADNERMPPVNWLRSFEACARLGSFTAAARELNITQPAVSHQIRLLEAFVKQPLFYQEGRSKHLTEAGKKYISFVQEAFDLLRMGSRMFVGSDQGSALTLRVNMAFTIFWLMPRLDDLYTTYPWINLNILPHISDIDQRPSNFQIEIINTTNYTHDYYRPLRDEYFFPVAAPSLVDSGLLDHSPLFDNSSLTSNWRTWFASGYDAPSSRRMNVSSTVTVSLMAAINGVGVALAHTSLFDAAQKTGKLVRPYQGQIKMKERYFVNILPEAKVTPSSEAFMLWLDNQCLND